ncbi:MAG: AI-2E family transporter [Gammaproteobacteria bacterium]|nr:AI-2E family transporter [Gammaproteobacteria bacterium]
MPSELLTPGQLRLVRYAVVATAATVLFVIGVLALWLLARVFLTFSTLLVPLAVAGIMALVLYPVEESLFRHLRVPRIVSAALLVVLMMALVQGLIWLIGPMLFEQVILLFDELSTFAHQFLRGVGARFPNTVAAVEQQLEEMEMGGVLPATDEMVATVGFYATLLAGLGFVPVFLFFFLLTGPRLDEKLAEVTSMFSIEIKSEILFLVGVFFGYIAAFFQGQLVIAGIMAVLYAVGFSLIGLDAAIPLGLISGLMNIIPFLGTLIGLILVVPYALFQQGGGFDLMLLALGVFITVQLVESWFLTPRIMSDRSGLHPAVVIFSLFFWGTIFGGFIGVMLAVPLSAFFATLWHQLRYRYATTVVYDRGPTETIITDPKDLSSKSE